MGFGAAGAIIGFGLSAYQGQTAVRGAKRGLRFQEEAQDRTKAAAASQRLKSQDAVNKADRKKPNIAAILEAAKRGGGLDPTNLTSGGFGSFGGPG